MRSDRFLVHYNPSLPLTLATDASPYGVGAVLSNLFPDGRFKREFTLITDNIPVSQIFSEIKDLPSMSAMRMLLFYNR